MKLPSPSNASNDTAPFAIEKSNSPALTSGITTFGPPCGTTRIFRSAFSIATFETAAPVAYASDPCGLDPTESVCALAAAAANMSPAAMRLFLTIPISFLLKLFQARSYQVKKCI